MIVACPQCDARYEFDESMQGKKFRCRECQAVVTICVPQPEQPEPPTPSKPLVPGLNKHRADRRSRLSQLRASLQETAADSVTEEAAVSAFPSIVQEKEAPANPVQEVESATQPEQDIDEADGETPSVTSEEPAGTPKPNPAKSRNKDTEARMRELRYRRLTGSGFTRERHESDHSQEQDQVAEAEIAPEVEVAAPFAEPVSAKRSVQEQVCKEQELVVPSEQIPAIEDEPESFFDTSAAIEIDEEIEADDGGYEDGDETVFMEPDPQMKPVVSKVPSLSETRKEPEPNEDDDILDDDELVDLDLQDDDVGVTVHMGSFGSEIASDSDVIDFDEVDEIVLEIPDESMFPQRPKDEAVSTASSSGTSYVGSAIDLDVDDDITINLPRPTIGKPDARGLPRPDKSSLDPDSELITFDDLEEATEENEPVALTKDSIYDDLDLSDVDGPDLLADDGTEVSTSVDAGEDELEEEGEDVVSRRILIDSGRCDMVDLDVDDDSMSEPDLAETEEDTEPVPVDLPGEDSDCISEDAEPVEEKSAANLQQSDPELVYDIEPEASVEEPDIQASAPAQQPEPLFTEQPVPAKEPDIAVAVANTDQDVTELHEAEPLAVSAAVSLAESAMTSEEGTESDLLFIESCYEPLDVMPAIPVIDDPSSSGRTVYLGAELRTYCPACYARYRLPGEFRQKKRLKCAVCQHELVRLGPLDEYPEKPEEPPAPSPAAASSAPVNAAIGMSQSDESSEFDAAEFSEEAAMMDEWDQDGGSGIAESDDNGALESADDEFSGSYAGDDDLEDAPALIFDASFDGDGVDSDDMTYVDASSGSIGHDSGSFEEKLGQAAAVAYDSVQSDESLIDFGDDAVEESTFFSAGQVVDPSLANAKEMFERLQRRQDKNDSDDGPMMDFSS